MDVVSQGEEAEHRLELAAAVAQMGIWEWNMATGAFYYSPRARSIYGFSPDQVITYEVLRERTHPDDYRLIEPILERAFDPKVRGREIYRYRINRADSGEERWLLAHGGALFSGEGSNAKAVRYTGTMQDITADVAAQE